MFLFAKSESFGYEPYIVTFDDEIVDEDNDGFASNVDCNDFDPTINPNAIEICDGKDNDCDVTIDEGLPILTYYVDADGDGFGTLTNPLSTCATAIPTGYVSNSQDCNDANPNIKPGAAELCDDLDNDCDTAIDEGLTLNSYYIDSDNDGFGAPATSITTCKSVAPSGYVINKTDCNDTNAAINPSATEIANNGIDEDCNGSDLISSTFDPVADKISIYPNPASESINILNENGGGFTVSVFTATGVKISTYQNPKSINVSNYENGVFILEFILDDNKISRFKKISVSH